MITPGEITFNTWADSTRDPRLFEELPGPIRAAWEAIAEDRAISARQRRITT